MGGAFPSERLVMRTAWDLHFRDPYVLLRGLRVPRSPERGSGLSHRVVMQLGTPGPGDLRFTPAGVGEGVVQFSGFH